ncbi:MAG: rRNA maturation RNase YbeY [Candidatus Falkowbacteria bacterium]
MIEINNTTKNKINSKKIISIVEIFIKAYKLKNFDVSVAVVGDTVMRKMNLTYRGFDKTTDVLSFSDLNEIVISYAQIKRQAKELKKGIESEFIFILVHGLFHLIGREDHTEKLRLAMIAEEEKFLKKYAII